MNEQKKQRINRTLELLFLGFVFCAILSFAIIQPFGDPPDEINRFRIVNYICSHGKLPTGSDPEVLIGGFGASYAFQPILTYIIQGFLLRFLTLFTKNTYVLLMAARLVNVCFGVLMAFFVRKISKEVFTKPSVQWLFSFLVVLLPMNLFIHSYVNTDSMAALSLSMIVYALLLGKRLVWNKKSCVLLSIGIILCAMSYYNAYGMVLIAILFFVYTFLHKEENKWVLDWKMMLQKGIFISVIVLFGIGWWFIRNAYLYDGDFFGMTARLECAKETALPDYNPLTRMTYQSEGIPLWEMVFPTGYAKLTYFSFIAMFGPMLIPVLPIFYNAYTLLFAGSLLCAIIPLRKIKRTYLPDFSKGQVLTLHSLFVVEIAITIALHLYYSYTWDFQPQGRYVLPILIPLMYFVTVGINKLTDLLEAKVPYGKVIAKVIHFAIMLFCLITVYHSIVQIVYPYYRVNTNMFEMLTTEMFGAYM